MKSASCFLVFLKTSFQSVFLRKGFSPCSSLVLKIAPTFRSGLKSKMYLFKVRGTAKIPDYVQLRDDDFTLIAYFRTDRPEKALNKAGLGNELKAIIEMIHSMPYGKMQKLILTPDSNS